MDNNSMTVFETTNFSKDIKEIDNYLDGVINQTTWQAEPIKSEEKEYIKYKPILDGWKKVKSVDIHIPSIEEEPPTEDKS